MNTVRHRNRQNRARQSVVRSVCIAVISALALTTLSSVVSSAPIVVQAPVLGQAVVGLRQGATGADVTTLQKALIAAGVTVPGGADGKFGPATKSALTAYQSRSGLPTTGEVDAATAAALGLTAPSPAATASGGLTVGARGDAVQQLQTALMSSGVFLPGGADGVFGPATRTAVSNFQRWNVLAVTGVVDAATASKLGLGSVAATPAATPAAAATPGATAGTGAAFVGLKAGARGDDVKVLQRALIAAGVSVRGGADGVFGPATAAALTSYQQANGLAATGVVDDAVIAKLALVPGVPTPAPTPPTAPTSAPTTGGSYVGLTVGSNGALVKDLQRALMQTGLALRGGADGVFGNLSRATLQQYQRSQGREQTGVVTDADAIALALGASGTPQSVSSQAGFAVLGERGERVKALQQSLLKAGITLAGGADGVFGAATTGAILTFQRREGLPATGRVDQATADRVGNAAAPAPTPPSSAGVTLEVFPVQGKCWFGDTWQAPRSGGRLHEGVDIIAARGNLLYAAVTGRISRIYVDSPGSLAGNGLRIAQDNGTYVTYLHMDTLAPGIALGVPVTAGQVVGTLG
ncbi:MAG: peptidoglycan-binding protein, partial [Cryobacterium sp.]|nr:peptidoglycan-binding protein [Cryobacterium sp.]